jgi:hypothetical protein
MLHDSVKFPSCYETQSSFTVFKWDRLFSLYSSRSIQFAGSHPVSLVTIVKTSSHFRRSLRRSYFLKIPLPNLRLFFPSFHSISPTHPWFRHPNNILRGVPSYFAISSILLSSPLLQVQVLPSARCSNCPHSISTLTEASVTSCHRNVTRDDFLADVMSAFVVPRLNNMPSPWYFRTVVEVFMGRMYLLGNSALLPQVTYRRIKYPFRYSVLQ